MTLLLIVVGCVSRSASESAPLNGRVVDMFGDPVPSSKITPTAMETRGFDRIVAAMSSSRTWSPRVLPSAESSSDGRFTCDACDWGTGHAYTKIDISKDGYVTKELRIYSGDQKMMMQVTLLPSPDSLRSLLAAPNAKANLVRLLALPRMELARNYFPLIGELRGLLTALIADSQTHHELRDAAHEAGFLLALNGAPEDQALIADWLVREQATLGFLESVSVGGDAIVGPIFPAGSSSIIFNPLFDVSVHDQIAETVDDTRRLYIGQWIYADPLGIHVESGEWISVLRKSEDGCRVVFAGTVWGDRRDRYHGSP
jgi:hypothetical protein